MLSCESLLWCIRTFKRTGKTNKFAPPPKKKPVSKQGCILRCGGLGVQSMNYGDTKFNPQQVGLRPPQIGFHIWTVRLIFFASPYTSPRSPPENYLHLPGPTL